MIAVVLALVLAILTLPSALNLPAANPGQTLEYAPVPGNQNAPAAGNFAGLGLGGNSGPGGPGGTGVGAPPPPAPAESVAPSSTKHCVGSPPRQTEDPLSPPCVSTYQGANGGATYKRGVSGSEVRILYYIACNGGSDLASDGVESPPCATLYDLKSPAVAGEPVMLRSLRRYQAYFNDRYETYGRRVHFYAYWSSEASDGSAPPALRRQDAADNLSRVDPFAVMAIDYDAQGDLRPYLDAMAQAGTMVFGTLYDEPESYYQQSAPLIWSYPPALEQAAQQFSSFVCGSVLNHTVSFGGDPAELNQARKLGLVYSNDPTDPELTTFAMLVKKEIEACGGDFLATSTFTGPGTGVSPGNQNNATAAMANFHRQGVTTVIWPQGFDSGTPTAAQDQGYYPEWVLAGDANIDDYGAMRLWPTSEASHAVDVTNGTLVGVWSQEYCGQAVLEVDPNFPQGDLIWACRLYPSLRQLFDGVQVAGPRLSPASVDQGFHAIPPHSSSDPKAPACYYDPGDYSCVKDAQAMWWDASGKPPSSSQVGCWRSLEAGSRYVAGHWPSSDVRGRENAGADPCDNYYTGAYPDDPTSPA